LPTKPAKVTAASVAAAENKTTFGGKNWCGAAGADDAPQGALAYGAIRECDRLTSPTSS
jgi:hypothetical protein